MGSDEDKQWVWLKTPPKMYGLFEIGDQGARWLLMLALIVAVILAAVWLL